MDRLVSLFRRTGVAKWLVLTIVCVSLVLMKPFQPDNSVLSLAGSLFSVDQWARFLYVARGTDAKVLPVTAILYDEDAYRSWGEPGTTPRDKIAEVVELVSRSEPLAIIIDVDLSYREQDGTNTGSRPLTAREKRLKDLLENYDENAPALIFAKSVVVASEPANTKHFRHTIYDEIVERKPNVFFGAVKFSRDYDRVIRKWSNWEIACGGERREALPSIHLLTTAIVRGGRDGISAGRRLSDRLQRAADQRCPDGKLSELEIADMSELVGPGLARQETGRVSLYFNPTPQRQGDQVRPEADLETSFGQQGGAKVRVYDGFSVKTLEEARENKQQISADAFKDRIVVFGVTHSHSQDRWQTALGPMPGMILLSNAISGAGALMNATYLAPVLANSIAVLVFLAFLGAFYVFRPMIAVLACMVLGAAAATALSMITVTTAALDIVAVALSMLLIFNAVKYALVIVSEFHSYGWRSIFLHPPIKFK